MLVMNLNTVVSFSINKENIVSLNIYNFVTNLKDKIIPFALRLN